MAAKRSNEQLAVHNGALLKKRKYTKWKSRWFALYDSRKLVYYEDYLGFKRNIIIDDINLTQVTKVSEINNKKIDKNYSFELVTPDRTYILGYKNKETLNKWIEVLKPYIFGDQIYEGWLIKAGENIRNRAWRKRWFVLSNFQEIRYYKDDKDDKSKGLGTIDLNTCIRIAHGESELYQKYPYSIEIITANRVWVLAADTSKAREVWMEKLKRAMNPFIKIKQSATKKKVNFYIDLYETDKHDLSNNFNLF